MPEALKEAIGYLWWNPVAQKGVGPVFNIFKEGDSIALVVLLYSILHNFFCWKIISVCNLCLFSLFILSY
jgi:hypothetical protein